MDYNQKQNEEANLIDQNDLLLKLTDVENKLADLKARWPYHSVQPKMVAEREELEEERERLLILLDLKKS